MDFEILNNDLYVSNPSPSTPVRINMGNCGVYFDAHKRNMTESMFENIVNKLGEIKIESADLKENCLKDNATTAKVIKKFFNRNLVDAHTIDLSYNQLGSEVAAVLVEVLPNCKKIEFLFLENNNFSHEDKEHISKAYPNIKIDF